MQLPLQKEVVGKSAKCSNTFGVFVEKVKTHFLLDWANLSGGGGGQVSLGGTHDEIEDFIQMFMGAVGTVGVAARRRRGREDNGGDGTRRNLHCVSTGGGINWGILVLVRTSTDGSGVKAPTFHTRGGGRGERGGGRVVKGIGGGEWVKNSLFRMNPLLPMIQREW